MSLSFDLIRAVRRRQEIGLSMEVRKKVVLHIADTLGIALAAYNGPPVTLQAISGISVGVSDGVGRVIGSDKQLPPAYAAFSNTALAHALDYDDINDLARIHPTPVILAAALAAADTTDFKAIDLITAVGLGNELVCRLGYSIEPKGISDDSKWFLSQLFGYLGAAVTAGLVLGLDDSKLVHALGLAYMQLAGGKESGVGVGSNARAIYPAFASMGGVQAAFLAQSGVTAPASSLDGKAGLFRIYLGKNLNEKQRKTLLETENWVFNDTAIKVFPCCRYSHPYIISAISLRKKFKVEQIKEIIIGVNRTANMLCNPIQLRCRPETLQDAKFSIPFIVAFVFIHGHIDLNNFSEEAINDTRVLELAKRVRVEQTQADTLGIPLGDIEVITAVGEYRDKERRLPEVTTEEIRKKIMECCRFVNIDKPEVLWEVLNKNLDYDIVNRLPTFKKIII